VTPLIFLHGIGTGPSAWKPQVEALSLDREVVSPNLVGLPWLGAIEAIRELVADRAPVDLCGLSLGALLALDAAAARPNDVRRLAVCAGFQRLPRGIQRRVRIAAWAMRPVPARLLHRQLTSDLPSGYRARAVEEIAAFGSGQLSRLMRAAAEFEVDPKAITAPTLVLCGARDRANLPLARLLAEALPVATLAVVPDAGHVANLDNPSAFTAILADFLTGSERRPIP
jgi:3-oxoadipate enol-lactonase